MSKTYSETMKREQISALCPEVKRWDLCAIGPTKKADQMTLKPIAKSDADRTKVTSAASRAQTEALMKHGGMLPPK